MHGASLAADGFGKGAGQRAQLRQHLELVEQAFGSLDVHQAVNALGDLVKAFNTQGEGHPPLAAELVDEHLVAGMALDVLKQQGRAAGSVVPLAALLCLTAFP